MLDAWFDAITNLPFTLDFVMWTGDNPPHDIWEESKTMQLFRTEYLVDRLYAAFPETTIYPALGNHETYPIDQCVVSSLQAPVYLLHVWSFVWCFLELGCIGVCY
jgi:sphingomyelin phosphodiesterase